MYRGRTNAVIYFLLCVSVLIAGTLVFKQVGFSYALKDRIAQSEDPYFSVKGLDHIVAMNEASLKTFLFIFICFMVILVSLVVVLQSTEKAYKLTNESNVRYTVKMTYPAIVLAAVGCFFLALAIYRTSALQMNTSSDLADQKNYQIVLDSLFNKKTELEQGISSLLQQKPVPAAAEKGKTKREQAVALNVPHKSHNAHGHRSDRRQNAKTMPDLSSVVGPIAPVITDNHVKKDQKTTDNHLGKNNEAIDKSSTSTTIVK